jgi:hypothetical protein
MGDALLYQIRIQLTADSANLARSDPANRTLDVLNVVLAKHNARMQCQLDAFLDYIREAETIGAERYPLYHWTKETVQDPSKRAKHSRSFTLYVDDKEVYPRDVADALETDLTPLLAGAVVIQISKYDTDIAHNPQPPAL